MTQKDKEFQEKKEKTSILIRDYVDTWIGSRDTSFVYKNQQIYVTNPKTHQSDCLTLERMHRLIRLDAAEENLIGNLSIKGSLEEYWDGNF